MEVNLVSYSQADGNFLIDSASAMEMVAYCARVSNPDNQMNTETSERLLKYLIKHKHWSPFEMVSACMEIKTTRDIARQILRHRSFSFQEFSHDMLLQINLYIVKHDYKTQRIDKHLLNLI